MFILEKIALLAGERSSVQPGTTATDDTFVVYDPETKEVTHGEDLKEVKKGSRLLVGVNSFAFLKTSDITEILEQTETLVRFNTTTSTYELRKI